MLTIFQKVLNYLTILLLFTTKLFAQDYYWPGPPVSYQQNTFFYLGKIIIHANIDNSVNRGYYLSLNNGLTWEKLTDPIFSTQRVINVEQSDSFFIVKTLTGYYLTTDFKTYEWAGKPREEITIGSNKFILTNNEKIGYKSLWLKQHQITKSNAKTWFVSPDRGFTWTDISGGLLTSKETYVSGGSIDWPETDIYFTVNNPNSFIATKTDYYAIYQHDFLQNGNRYDLIRYNFINRTWEQIAGTNYYQDVAKNSVYSELSCYNPKTNSIFLFTDKAKLFRSQDRGITWTTCGNGLPSYAGKFNLKMFVRNDTIFAVTTFITSTNEYPYITDLNRLFYSTDDGINFIPIPHNLPLGIALEETLVSSSGTLLFSGSQCQCAYIQQPNAYTFLPRTLDSDFSELEALLMIDSARAIVQSGYSGVETAYGIFLTEDKGKNWINITKNLRNKSVKASIQSYDTLLVLTPYARYTTDWGNSWHSLPDLDSMISFNNALKIDSFFFLSTNDNNIYRSTDLIHWQHHTTLGRTNQFTAPIVYSFKGRLFNGEFWSNDYGITWIECKKKTPGRILHVSQLANGDLINFYYNYFYYKTAVSHDNGITWQDTLVSQWENIKNITQHGQYIYCLTDNGIRVLDKLTLSLVREYPVGESISLGSEVYYANNHIYATALYGGLYLWEDDLPTGTNQQKPIVNSDKIYPNPADRYITIENSNKEMVECALINMAGDEILTRKGNSKFTIETTDVPDGLYIIKLETTKGISYSKILIVH